uniref:Exosome component 1 n=1 Tax=Cebus imitator TaxID=2715852 RepID=A0A2K5Q986_CEBIM
MAPPVRYCIPGERLCNLEEGSPGSGTYTRHGYIFSSLAGCLMKSCENGALKFSSVRMTQTKVEGILGSTFFFNLILIELRGSKTLKRFVGKMVISCGFFEKGQTFLEDVRATEKDKVSRANLWGLGSATSFSLPGVQMVPISWCEMQCPKTHTKEFRKVARVQPEFLQT